MKKINLVFIMAAILVFGLWLLFFMTSGCSQSTSTSTTSTTTSTSSTTTTTTAPFTLSSSAFSSGEAIPTQYAYTDVTGGQDKSVPLAWSGAPTGTRSYALSMIDISAMNFVHWLVTIIPDSVSSLAENLSSAVYTQYSNDTPSLGYDGPYPPASDAAHTYVITLYALNTTEVSFTNNTNGMNLTAFNSAISGKKLGQAVITGTFDR